MPIINGVEVSDCIYYEPKALKMICHEQAITKPCGTSPICYYKLLHKAYKNCECLEQENETLKSQLDFEVQKKEVLEAENEKLREVLEIWKYSDVQHIFKITKYKQALQEIKTIAENCMNKDGCFECKYSDDCYIEDAEIPTYDICKLLIQNITKAEEE